MHWRRLKVHNSSRIHHRVFLLLKWTGSHLFPGMKASCFRSRIVEMDFFIPFLLLSFWVNFSLPFRSRLLGMFFFHASSVPKLWNGIFHSLSHLRKSHSLSSLLGFVAYPSFSLFLHMHFEVSPIYWTPAMDLWRWLFVIFCPSIYIDTDACILYYFVFVLTYFWVPPYIEEANNRSREVYMVFCLSTISQQWIYGGGCTWYFVPLSTLTSHSRWSKKLRDTSSLWWKSPEKNFLLPPKGPFVSHLVRPSATDIKRWSIERNVEH